VVERIHGASGVVFQNRVGHVALDQLRTVDQERVVKRLGTLSSDTVTEVLAGLQDMFAE